MTNARTARTERAEKAAQLRAAAARAETRRRALVITSAVVAVVVVVIAVFAVIQNSRRTATSAASGGGGTPHNLVVGANGFGPVSTASISYGDPSAPVTLIAYEDFQCPVCREFEQQNNAQIEKWVAAKQVRVLYRPIAFLDNSSSTRYSTRALNAAAAVLDTDPAAFKAYHDTLYANQPAEGTAGLTDAKLIDLAVAAGADRATITPLVNDEKFKAWTATVTDASSKTGVTGTPTLIVDGKQLQALNQTTPPWSPQVLDAAVNGALGAKK